MGLYRKFIMVTMLFGKGKLTTRKKDETIEEHIERHDT